MKPEKSIADISCEWQKFSGKEFLMAHISICGQPETMQQSRLLHLMLGRITGARQHLVFHVLAILIHN